MKKRGPPETIDEYLATVPEEARAALVRLRKLIRAAAPKATEVISYQVPSFVHHGMLVGFGASAKHCTFYVMSTALIREWAGELDGYEVGKGSIRFAADEPLPARLVTRIVKARIAENEQRRGA